MLRQLSIAEEAQASQNILRVHDGLAWLSQIGMFLMLGLLIAPHELVDIAVEGTLIALLLIFVARPVAVLVSLLPFRFPWREQVFIGWVGLRGAVPIILALFPMIAGIEHGRLFFNIAFFVVLISLVLQGWTVGVAARALKLEIPPTSEPAQRFNLDLPGHYDREIACYEVAPESYVVGTARGALRLPADSHVTMIVRDANVLPDDKTQKLQPGDLVYIFTDPTHVPELNRLFDAHDEPPRLDSQRFYGDFVLDGEATVQQIADAYGLPIAAGPRDEKLADYLFRLFHGRAVEGDATKLGSAELVVREIENDRITKVGLRVR